MHEWALFFRILTAAILGGVIGWERGGTNHDAGLRTHMLVAIGSAAIMVVSEELTQRYSIPDELLRMGAQVVSGIGFLGAGCIVTDGNRVRGITTAAGIWVTACVGLLVGSGTYLLSFFTVVLVMIIMFLLRPFAKHLNAHSPSEETARLTIVLSSEEHLKDILNGIEAKGTLLSFHREGDECTLLIETFPSHTDSLLSHLFSFESVKTVQKKS